MMCVTLFPRAISHMMSALVYPLVTFVLVLVCVAYWGVTALYPFIFFDMTFISTLTLNMIRLTSIID